MTIRPNISTIPPNWKKLHRLSERLASLGLMWAQLRAPLKTLRPIVL